MVIRSLWIQAGTSLGGIGTTVIEEEVTEEVYRAVCEWTSFYRLSASPVNPSITLNMMISKIWYAHVGRGAMGVDGCPGIATII